MRIDIMTLFPDVCNAYLSESIIGRARQNNKIEINCHNIRDYTEDKHKRVDDSPYGGGFGMIMQAEPIYQCYMAISEEIGSHPHLIYLTPQGKTLTQKRIVELSKEESLTLLCGHYEGVDERVIDELKPEEISIGDYVLTGGELGALVISDAVARLQDGVLSDEECFIEESHYNNLLEYPQYTHPYVWRGRQVPEVLISGHHENINKWKRRQSILRTFSRRPDMLDKAEITKEEKDYIKSLKNENC